MTMLAVDSIPTVPIDTTPEEPESVLIIYHANCPDGFGSAWLIRRGIRAADEATATTGRTIELFEGKYGEEPPLDLIRATDTTFIVDFCYPTEQLNNIASETDDLVVLDHHQTAAQWLADSDLRVFGSVEDLLTDQTDESTAHDHVAVMNQGRSGIGLASDFVFTVFGLRAPDWARHIEDRDLWRFGINGTAEVFAAVTSHPMTLNNWDLMASMGSLDLYREGTAIARYRNKLIAEIVDTAFEAELLGHRVWIAGSPYAVASDVAGVLAIRNPKLFGAYFIITGETVKWGLRSTPDGMDVAELAAVHGGGGHKHAAGFEWPVSPFGLAVVK